MRISPATRLKRCAGRTRTGQRAPQSCPMLQCGPPARPRRPPPQRARARERDLDFFDDDVEVHRRPVPLVGAAALAGTDRTGLLAQKEEGSWPACQLRCAPPERPPYREPEGSGEERNSGL